MARRVAVVGSGPAGLFAALAAINEGARVDIHTPHWAKPAVPPGVFVLHDAMGLPLPSAQYMEVRRYGGDAAAYANKVYGDSTHPTSWSRQGPGLVYDGARAIGLVWDILKGAVSITERSCRMDDVLRMADGGEYDLVVNTAPLSVLSDQWALLPLTNAWVYTGTAPSDECYMMYHANPCVPWYRASAAFGRFTLEFSTLTMARNYFGADIRLAMVNKVRHASDLKLPERPRLVYTGRQGAWDKDKLSHHGYSDTLRALRTL